MSLNDSAGAVLPFFLPGSAGWLFALYFSPSHNRATKRAVLYFPPFAEEMNKARRMAALQARRFADLGIGTLLIDPFGTADSEGDFADARWEIWRDDLQRAAQWLHEQGAERLIFWGLRLGGSLAVELATMMGQPERLILWHPVIRGETFMTQFLRLRLAADMASKGQRLTTRDLRADLSAGNALEIAGYALAPALVSAVDALNLEDAGSTKMPVVDWVEIVADTERPLSSPGQRVLDCWRTAGVQATSHTVVGEQFWCTPEITVAPALLDVTANLLTESSI